MTITEDGSPVVPGIPAIVNGYISLDEFHAMKRVSSTDNTDDVSICFLIESASRYIDHNCSRRFYLNGQETHYFDVPGWEAFINGGGSYYTGYTMQPSWNEPKLRMDDDLYSVTTVTNGDGTTLVENTDFVSLPYNAAPKYALSVINNMLWKTNSIGSAIKVISVTGQWGFCPIANVPADIAEATFMIASAAYARRTGENVTNRVAITSAGAVIAPDDVPSKAWDSIKCHMRVSFG